MVATDAGFAGQLYSCARAATGTAAVAILNAVPTTAEDAASAMRLALGLPIDR